MKNHISVLGSGAWGTALAQLISKNNSVLMWVKEKSVKNDINQSQNYSVISLFLIIKYSIKSS